MVSGGRIAPQTGLRSVPDNFLFQRAAPLPAGGVFRHAI
jgi:hypothetical protein